MVCFVEPIRVFERMRKYESVHGHEAFLKKLARRPEFFGRRRDLESGETFTSVSHCRAAMALLPVLFVRMPEFAQHAPRMSPSKPRKSVRSSKLCQSGGSEQGVHG